MLLFKGVDERSNHGVFELRTTPALAWLRACVQGLLGGQAVEVNFYGALVGDVLSRDRPNEILGIPTPQERPSPPLQPWAPHPTDGVGAHTDEKFSPAGTAGSQRGEAVGAWQNSTQ